MAKPKRAPTLEPAGVLDWTGARTERLEYGSAATIFAEGDPATSVLYVETGTVRLSVVSHSGKEAVVAVLDAGHFFGEGCLAGQSRRMATATAMEPCIVLSVEQQEIHMLYTLAVILLIACLLGLVGIYTIGPRLRARRHLDNVLRPRLVGQDTKMHPSARDGVHPGPHFGGALRDRVGNVSNGDPQRARRTGDVARARAAGEVERSASALSSHSAGANGFQRARCAEVAG